MPFRHRARIHILRQIMEISRGAEACGRNRRGGSGFGARWDIDAPCLSILQGSLMSRHLWSRLESCRG